MKKLFYTILSKQKVFLALFLLAFIAMGTLLFFVPKADLHLLLNRYHSPNLDVFILHYSDIVKWLPIVVGIALFLYKFWYGAFFASNVLLVTLIVQPIKTLVNAPRPITFFTALNLQDLLPIVEGLKLHAWRSFPSGHTANFFLLFFTLSILVALHYRGRKVVIFNALFFFLALLGGYSRIYLSQHFTNDVWIGMFIGCFCCLICIFAWIKILHHTKQNKFLKYSVWNKLLKKYKYA